METQAILMYSTGGIGCCLATAVLFSNGFSLFRYLTRDGEEPATSMSLVGWALSLAFLVIGPCGLITAMIACSIGSSEKKKVALGEASGWTLIPCSAITMNVLMSLFLMVLMIAAGVAFAMDG